MRSLQCNRSSSVRAQRLARVQLEPTPRTHARTCMRETCNTSTHPSAPNTHHKRELPDIFLPLASTTVFSIMDGPTNVMQLRLQRPGRKAQFLSWFFVIEVGAHHIYDDTGFCHNYRHRSVICMTEKKFVRPKMSRMCLFFVVKVVNPVGEPSNTM